ncbi:hypothetical protein SADUNF_Sadunf07G0111900 [Salix dunnii]|uniref:F-box domain-containing protein n=1 Tax=Salix dunnii TaxID=1413687 RepID=A0A835K1V6_9ROSI|nr:hypothetical protein SADUNF_Sadunf07G0111900 [Salix dunnii]
MSCYISNLPHHILETIFSIVTISALKSCRDVCKSWKHILTNPSFALLHQHGCANNNLILCLGTKLTGSYFEGNIYRLEYGESSHFNRARTWALEPDFTAGFVNSCNGLVFMLYSSFERIKPYYRSFNASVNGSFHWIIDIDDDYDRTNIVYSFNFESEQFTTSLLPIPPVDIYGYCYQYADLGVLGDSLYCSYFSYLPWNDCINICVMKDHGVVESWAEMLVIEHRMPFWEPRDFKVIKFFENRNFLFLADYHLWLANSKNKIMRSEDQRISEGRKAAAAAQQTKSRGAQQWLIMSRTTMIDNNMHPPERCACKAVTLQQKGVQPELLMARKMRQITM